MLRVFFVVVICGNLSFFFLSCFFFQAEDGIRDLVRSRGLGDVYKRQGLHTLHQSARCRGKAAQRARGAGADQSDARRGAGKPRGCLLYTSDAADERSSVDLGGRRIIKKKNKYESESREERR